MSIWRFLISWQLLTAHLAPNGNLVSTSGAIIPEGYDLDYTIPNLPWICPVRNCRYVFKGRTELGCHFVVRYHTYLMKKHANLR